MPEAVRSRVSHHGANLAALLLVAIAGFVLARFGPKRFAEVEIAGLVLLLAFWRVELAYIGAFVVAFLGGSISALNHWDTVAPAIVVLIAVRELVMGDRPVLSWPLLAYAASFLIAIVGGVNPASGIAAIQYLVGPGLALVTAWASRSALTRRRIILMIIGFSLIQFPLVLLQTVANISVYGNVSVSHADKITGGAGANGSGRVMVVCLIAAAIVLAMAIERVGNRPLLALLCVALVVVGVLDVAKAVFFMAPVTLGGVLLASGARRRAGRWGRRLLGVLALVVVLPGLIFISEALYPGSTKSLSSASSLQNYLFDIQTDNGPDAPPPRGVQIQEGLALMKADGLGHALFGHGLGITKLQAVNGINDSSKAGLLLTPAQQSNNFWITRLAVETGYVGLIAWFLLLGWLLFLARRARRRARPGSADAAAALALYGVVPLMLISTFYDTSPVSDLTAVSFWTLVGVVAAVAYGRPASRVAAANRRPVLVPSVETGAAPSVATNDRPVI